MLNKIRQRLMDKYRIDVTYLWYAEKQNKTVGNIN